MKRWPHSIASVIFLTLALALIIHPEKILAQTLVVDEWGKLHIVSDGQVLGKGSDDGGGGEGGGGSGGGFSGSGSSGSGSSGGGDSGGSSGSLSSGESSGRPETKIEVRAPEGRFRQETKTRSDGTVEFRQEVRTAQGVQRIRVKDGKLEIRVKPAEVEEGEDLDELDKLSQELGEEEEEPRVVERIKVRERADKNEVEIRADGTRLEIRQGRVRARTNFPLSVGSNNELIVTTPAGAREVAILPDTAVSRLLASGVLSSVSFTGVPAGLAGATGADGALAPTTTPGEQPTQEVVLTEQNGFLVYRVNGTKTVKFLGLTPVVAPVTANVSAETGAVMTVSQPWYLNTFGFLFR